ncbi:MAG: PoNi-like cognate immunity protein [Betaproteobacteria bacterium]|nr:PoNi-like cognate immunity protein [Betaproteobacteria bacterium]
MRDANKDEAYFFKRIEFRKESIVRRGVGYIQSLSRDEGRAGAASDLPSSIIKLIVLKYGRGDTIESICPDLWRWVEAMEFQAQVNNALPADKKDIRDMYERITLDTVYNALTIFAFAVALRLDATEMMRVINAIRHPGEDALIDEAARALGDVNRPVADACKFPKVYASLLEVWRSPAEQRAEKLQTFGQQWKRKIRPIYWSNSLEGAEGAYFGYWCFDIALAAIVLKIDDHGLRSNSYYPTDLVDYARSAAIPTLLCGNDDFAEKR